MPTTPFGISFTDLTSGTDGYTETYSRDGMASTRNVSTAWSSRVDFVAECLGYVYPTARDGLQVTKFARQIPLEHPELEKFWCTAVDSIQPLTPASQGASPTFHSFSNIHYALHYQPLPFDVEEDPALYQEGELCRYVERKINFTGENLTVGHGAFTWVTAPNEPIFQPPAKIFPVVELEYIWRKVPAIPFSNINSCIGKVNTSTFDVGPYARKWGVPSGGWLAQTVLFIGARAEMITNETNVFGTAEAPVLFDIYYKFLYRYNGGLGWNYLWRPQANAFQLVTHNGAGGGNRIYETASLATLFQLS